MAFTVNDFEDFMAVLGQHPEWQERLRNLLVDERLADVRRELLAAQQRFQEELEALTTTVRAMAEENRSFQAEMREFRLDATQRISALDRDMAVVKGRTQETWYRDRASRIFGHLLHSVQIVSFADVPEIRAARRAGIVTNGEWTDLRSLDLLISGLDDVGDERRLIAMEISSQADQDDVFPVERRTSVLRKAFPETAAAIGAQEIPEPVLALARERGVGVMRQGEILFWPGRT